jgi:hypothetical protein
MVAYKEAVQFGALISYGPSSTKMAHQFDGLRCPGVLVDDDTELVQHLGIVRLRSRHLPANFFRHGKPAFPAMLLRKPENLGTGHELTGSNVPAGSALKVRLSNSPGFLALFNAIRIALAQFTPTQSRLRQLPAVRYGRRALVVAFQRCGMPGCAANWSILVAHFCPGHLKYLL